MSAFETCLVALRADATIRRRLETQGLSLSELAALHHLQHAPERTRRRADLAERLGMSASGVARLLAPLEKQGYVLRRSDPRDARLALVVLTDVGAERSREALDAAEEQAESLLEHAFTSRERERLEELLTRLVPAA